MDNERNPTKSSQYQDGSKYHSLIAVPELLLLLVLKATMMTMISEALSPTCFASSELVSYSGMNLTLICDCCWETSMAFAMSCLIQFEEVHIAKSHRSP
jgi:hypothetical protein